MKNIEATPLWSIVSKILKQQKTDSRTSLIAKIHTKNKDIECYRLVTMDIERDYAHTTFEYIQVKLAIPLGDFVYDIYPYRHNLEVSIYKRQISSTNNSKQIGKDILLQRYKAIFPSDINNEPVGTELSRKGQEELNLNGLSYPQLQLLDRQIEPIRVVTIGGTIRQKSYEDIIKIFVESESNKIKVDGRSPIEAIDIVKPDNSAIQSQTLIPYTVKLTGLTTYLQEYLLGLYNAGLGTFIQRYKNKLTWFVYPLFKTVRLNTKTPNAIFYFLPKERFTSSEFTYIEEGNTLHVLVVGDRSFSDSAEVDFMDLGSGIRLADSNQFITKPVELTDDGPVATRRKLNTEIKLLDREDGLNYIPMSNKTVSGNPFVELSKVVARSGSTINISWHNSMPDLIYPGMNCKIAYLENDKVKYRTGVILFSHSYSNIIGENITNNTHQTSTAVSVFLEREKT